MMAFAIRTAKPNPTTMPATAHEITLSPQVNREAPQKVPTQKDLERESGKNSTDKVTSIPEGYLRKP
jgi:hypothetical protein